MSIARQDAWNQDEDLLLAEVVLRHIREGSTQLRAFEEVGRQLSRTSAACGFRWNSFVRKQYKSGIELAKKQRKEYKTHESSRLKEEKEPELENVCTPTPQQETVQTPYVKTSISIQDVIAFLKEKEEITKLYQQDQQHHTAEYENLKLEIDRLSKENETLQTQLKSVEEDYRALLQIMERARKLIVHEDDKVNSKVKFQMDKNGNLERVNK